MTISRRQFLRGNIISKGPAVRPPWSLPEAAFISTCTRCSLCTDNCPEKIIVTGLGGYPEIRFNEGGCSFCGECVAVCEVNALQHSSESLPWTLTATITGDCLARQNVTCHACIDACEPEAIHLYSTQGGVSHPVINISRCTGCGFCVYPCPVQAIKVTENSTGDELCQ